MFEQRPSGILKEEYSKQKELWVPKTKSMSIPDVFEEQQESQCGWSKDSDRNSGKKKIRLEREWGRGSRLCGALQIKWCYNFCFINQIYFIKLMRRKIVYCPYLFMFLFAISSSLMKWDSFFYHLSLLFFLKNFFGHCLRVGLLATHSF